MGYIKSDKVYVYLPGRIPCGGVELAHQLVDRLRNRGKEAFVVYGEDVRKGQSGSVMDCYNMYDIKTTIQIEDNPKNVLVLPETAYGLAKTYTQIQIACWWMSVDNFVQHELHYHQYQWDEKKKIYQNVRKWIHVRVYHLPIKAFDILDYLRKQQHRVIHMCQSKYACEYIKSQGLQKYYPLSDFINLELLPKQPIDMSKKENVVLYNPKKGLKYTEMVIKHLPQYSFVALQGMNRKELNDCFDKAKLYIDFGSFPGKDRLPREAVMHDCCILTGKNGASAYYEDVPISDRYKFDTIEKNIPDIVDMIHNVMRNYGSLIFDFEEYKSVVRSEIEVFYSEIENIFF